GDYTESPKADRATACATRTGVARNAGAPSLSRNQREDAYRRARAALDLQRRHDDRELVGPGRREFLQVQVLDDVDAGIGDQPHVDREHLELRCGDHGRALLEG